MNTNNVSPSEEEEELSIINDLALVPWKYIHLKTDTSTKQFVTRFKLDPDNKDCCFKILVSDFESVWVGKGSNKSVSRDILSNNPHLDFTLEEGISLLQESFGISSNEREGGEEEGTRIEEGQQQQQSPSSPSIDIALMNDDKLVLVAHKKIDFYNFKVPVVCTVLGSGSTRGPQPSTSYKAQAAFIRKYLVRPLLTLGDFLIGNAGGDSLFASFDSYDVESGSGSGRHVLCSELFAMASKKMIDTEKKKKECDANDVGEKWDGNDNEKGEREVSENDQICGDDDEDGETSLKRKLEVEEKLKKQTQNRLLSSQHQQPTKKKKRNGFL